MGEVCEVASKKTRHHMLYPRKVWMRAGQDAFDVRNAFTVMMPGDLHLSLHRKIDKKLGENLSEDDLPDERTFQRVLAEYKKNEKIIKQYEPCEQLLWLKKMFGLEEDDGTWFEKLIELELVFLEIHKDEL